MTKVLIFGGTRGTGLEAARELAARGEHVTAVVRESSDTAELDALGAATVTADIFSAESVSGVFAAGSYDAVVLSLSGKRGEEQRPDREGVRVIVEVAREFGVKRVVMVTAIGSGDSRDAVAPKVLEVLGEVLAIKTEAEDFLMGAGVDATIVRPGGLADAPASGTGVLSDDHMTMGVINRSDLGALVADCITDNATIGNVYHAVDPEIKWQAPLQRGEDVPR
ncbi:MAG: NAD(P)H-binding protein [Gammaproteobacteria bacterium]|nr:NAD(P)H-binding protein [Gammaproteobacteria bacterium]